MSTSTEELDDDAFDTPLEALEDEEQAEQAGEKKPAYELTEEDKEALEEIKARGWGYVADPAQMKNGKAWVPPAEFVRRGKEIEGYTRHEVSQLKAEVARRDEELARLREEYHADRIERLGEKYAAVEAARERAIEDGDKERRAELEKQRDAIVEEYTKLQERAASKQPQARPEQPESATSEFAATHPWYEQDAFLRYQADRFSAELVKEINEGKAHYTKEQAFHIIAETMKERYPSRFKTQAEQPAKAQQRRVVPMMGAAGGGYRGAGAQSATAALTAKWEAEAKAAGLSEERTKEIIQRNLDKIRGEKK